VTVMTGGEAIVRMLEAYGVTHGFGMGGFQGLPYYDAIVRRQSIRHVVVRDEKDGVFAADGYARVTNRPAVADGTLGPGATNLISGAAELLGASIPGVLLTSEVNTSLAGRGATQESDQFGMLKPTCKASIRIGELSRIPELMRRGLSAACGGRPGPVNIDVPEEVFHGFYDFGNAEFVTGCIDGLVPQRVRPDPGQIEKAAELLRLAKRPLLVAGGGIHLSKAYQSLLRLADLIGLPVATTISGKGSIPERHALSVGLCGRYSRIANDLIRTADVIIVVGSKLGEIATNRWALFGDARLIHIDIDPLELGKVVQTDVGIWGDAALALDDLAAAIGGRRSGEARESQLAEIANLKRRWSDEAERAALSEEHPIHMARLLKELRSVLPPDAIIVADGGFAAHWSALLYDVAVAGRTYIANRGHAAIGYGLPGSIGAKLGSPGSTVVALCGDNGFAMAAAELETARRSGANILAVVVNNGSLGYVKALQHALYDDRFISVDFLDTDYSAVARAFGCEGIRVADPSKLSSAVREGLDVTANTPCVLDVLTTTDPGKMLPGVDSRTLGEGAGPPAQSDV
jgi:acetolactate synthase-1/2/3 large subunit